MSFCPHADCRHGKKNLMGVKNWTTKHKKATCDLGHFSGDPQDHGKPKITTPKFCTKTILSRIGTYANEEVTIGTWVTWVTSVSRTIFSCRLRLNLETGLWWLTSAFRIRVSLVLWWHRLRLEVVGWRFTYKYCIRWLQTDTNPLSCYDLVVIYKWRGLPVTGGKQAHRSASTLVRTERALHTVRSPIRRAPHGDGSSSAEVPR